MNKLTREQFDTMGPTTTWHYIDALQEELESEQGFVVDWDEAPEWADEVSIMWHNGYSAELIETIPRPTPPKATRARTNVELCNAWIAEQYHDQEMEEAKAWELLAINLADGCKIADLCTADGISLTVLEEV